MTYPYDGGSAVFKIWLRRGCLGAIALLCIPLARAQVPETIVVAKVGIHEQTSPTSLTPEGQVFILDAYAADFVIPTVTVRLQKPDGTTVSLSRMADDAFGYSEYFATDAELTSAYPNGNYNILVDGGALPTKTALMFSAQAAAPVTITNYTALQMATATAQPVWQPIPAAGVVEQLNLRLLSAGGVELSSEDLWSARATTGTLSNLLAGETYTAMLTYYSFDLTTANDGQTRIGNGNGFAVTFPVFRGAATPAPPATPIAAGAYASGPSEVTISWQPPGGSNPPTGYRLERAVDASFQTDPIALILNFAATSFVDTRVVPNTTYYYRLLATNATGASSPTATMKVQTPAAAGVGATSFVNISARAYCSTGNNVTIGGFVVAGTKAKRVLVRAVGPSLIAQGIGAAEALLDPTIEVHHGLPVIAANDNWRDNSNAAEISTVGAQVGATPLVDTDTKSAVLLLTLEPGVYSFVVTGKSNSSGIVLLEIYDADAASGTSTFVNISTRAYSTVGNGVTIGGFVIGGGASKTVLLRAVGPTLTTQGIASGEALADPVIELHRGVSVIASNDNWISDPNANLMIDTAARIGAAALSSGDITSAGLLLKLPPGVYSFIARGKSETSGIVLVEVYDAD